MLDSDFGEKVGFDIMSLALKKLQIDLGSDMGSELPEKSRRKNSAVSAIDIALAFIASRMITTYLFEYWDECRLYFSQPLLADSFAPITLMLLFLVATAALSAVFLLLATGIGDSFHPYYFAIVF